MSQQLQKEDVLRYLETWDGFEKSISEEGEAYKVIAINGSKAVVITTPYEVGEFYLEFSVDNEPYYYDWFEIMDESLSEFMLYTNEVVERYLFHEVRIISKGWLFFRSSELQFQNNGSWCNVFNSKT